MSNVRGATKHVGRPVVPERSVDITRSPSGGLLVVVGAVLIVLAHQASDGGGGRRAALVGAVGATVAIALAGACLLCWARADSTRVFRSRSLARVVVLMLGLTVLPAVHLVRSPPFTGIVATGRFHSDDIADLGCLTITLVCLFTTFVSVGEWWSALRTERNWPTALRTDPRPPRPPAT